MTHRLSRGELYDLVWAQPMKTLAIQFGISDVAVAKACRRANIPVPERGYWAKRQAGKQVTQKPLAPRGPGMSDEVSVGGRPYRWYQVSNEELLESLPPPPEFSEDIGETRKRALKLIKNVRVQKTISQPHPLIGRLLEEDKDRREKQLASPYPYSWDKPLFESPSEQRRLRILNALFLALDDAGFAPWLRGREGRDLGIRVGGQSVSVKLEPNERSGTRKKSDRKAKADPLRFDILVSSGGEEIRHSWEDAEDGRLERWVRDIAVEIIVAGEIAYRESIRSNYEWRVRRKAQLEENARQRAAEIERQEREQQARIEKERIDRLLNDAKAFTQANEIRAYVETVRATVMPIQNSVESGELDSWSAWALAEADRIDPIKIGRFRI